MASLERDTTRGEPTTPVDDESFATAVHAAADLLESPLVRPDAESFELAMLPFGPFKEGSLSTSVTLSDNVINGKISFRSGRADRRGDFYLFKTPLTSDWHDEDGLRRVDNAALINRLISEWPFESRPYRPTHGKVADIELQEFLNNYLLPHATEHTTEKSYRHNQMELAFGKLVYDSTTAITIATTPDNPKKVQLTATLAPARDNSSDPLRCRATVIPEQPTELRIFEHSSDLNGIREISVHGKNRPYILGSLILLLDRLTAEKYPLA